jgi:hypothetical protein
MDFGLENSFISFAAGESTPGSVPEFSRKRISFDKMFEPKAFIIKFSKLHYANVLMTDECHCKTLKSKKTICKSQAVAHLKKCSVALVHVHLVRSSLIKSKVCF